ncbi:hypothetical protein MP228_006251 [Amoeboaphelidium protococcarum]|nr:hypothetical protein MP228_006251 [Amoeboaphelidium protococcarum]
MKFTFLLLAGLALLTVLVQASGSEQHAFVPPNQVEDLDELSKDYQEQIEKESQKFEFQAEVNRMMKLIIHSLYKVKEIFLRELISNASDALDKVRFLSLTDKSVLEGAGELNITVKADADRNILVIRDAGIGMTKDELVKNLGTIAKSGTNEFLQQLEKKGADQSQLIGQFGVGFYSAFLVADRVTVISKSNKDADQYIWESNAESDFKISKDPRGNTLGRGTQIVLHLKPEAAGYLEEAKLEKIIRKYSEFINFPIYLLKNKTETVEVPLSEEELEKAREKKKVADELKKQKKKQKDVDSEETVDGEDEKKDEAEAEVEDVEDAAESEQEEEEELKTTKEVERKYLDWELMNPSKPIWTRDPKNVTEKEYQEFYRQFGKDTQDPMSYIHFNAEGDVDFKSLLFIPSKAPSNMLQIPDLHIKAIKLFVKRVFITDELLDFLPKYLGFLKGLVDSDDLPLNVSRETLQKHRTLKAIRRKIVRKALDMIRKLSMDDEKYEQFLKEYGTNLKLGAIEDSQNKKVLTRLLRFHSSKTSSSDKKRTSLESYVKRMKKGQEQIFFLTGPSLEEIKRSPFVERIIARGYEVLYLDEPIDEYLVQSIPDFEKKRFQNVAKDGLKFGDESDESQDKLDALNTEYKPLTEYFKTVLGSQIDKVSVSNRLTKSPCAIVASQYGWSGNMERLYKSQAMASGNEDMMMQYQLMQKKNLEINPKHPLISKLLKKISADEQDSTTEELVNVLYETTAIRSGYMVKDTADFASRIERVLRVNLGVDVDAEAEVDDIIPAPEPDASTDDSEDDAESSDQKYGAASPSEEEDVEDVESFEEFEHDEL